MALTKVRYKGLSDEREMSQEDLAAAGVELSGGLRWDRTNRLTGLLIENPSQRLLDIFAEEGTFTVTEVDADTNVEGQEIISGQPQEYEAPVVKDATSGQVSTKDGGQSEEDPKVIAKKAASSSGSTAGASDKTKAS